MDGVRVYYAIIIALVAYVDISLADHVYMVTTPESLTLTPDLETTLTCKMNIQPDKFQWKFYPLREDEVSNPLAEIDLSNADFILVSMDKYDSNKDESRLSIQANGERIAGDYQCLAYYGASVVASVPWRITMANIGSFPKQKNIDITVRVGNTVNWKCDPPQSNPQPYIDYYKDLNFTLPYPTISKKSLIIPDASPSDSGRYTCQATNTQISSIDSHASLNLKVVQTTRPQPPTFIIPPQQSYAVTKGETVLLECSAIGSPKPAVVWEKKSGSIRNDRAEMLDGGLRIRNVSALDSGVYICKNSNSEGSISHQITLSVNSQPEIDCMQNNFDDVKQGELLDLICTVTGHPKPKLSWFLNGFSVKNDSAIETNDNKIRFKKVEKRHAGNLQIFARNIVKTNYSTLSIKVFPLSTSIDLPITPPQPYNRPHRTNSSRRPLKQIKMIPPSKPTVSRLDDHSVMVRWSVSTNKGLPIQFFKVQYRELGSGHYDHHTRTKGSKWNTANADIQPHITSYEVNNLRADHWYRFRIAAVYSNNDNKLSNNSEKFYLKKMDFDNRNPLPVPLITQTEAIDSTSVKIYWKYDPVQDIRIDGFLINYNSASSAADYVKVSVDGENTTSYVLNHLQPDSAYDIKLQSFTSKSASEFSAIMKAKTKADPSTPTTTIKPTSEPTNVDNSGISYKLYAIIACILIGGVGTVVGVGLLLFCRKWKQKKNNNRGDRDKPAVDDHHIQVEGNEYVVGPKSQPRANGTTNRITITPNPLADADNKNQNMIEMSCLSSQNNNCTSPAGSGGAAAVASTTTTTTVHQSSSGASSSGSGEESTSAFNSKDRKNRNHEKLIRNTHNTLDSNTSGENYV